MVIKNNLSALNTLNYFSIAAGHNSKHTEKLSSGYRINRSADDAAGLAISEKLRAQISGLNQASANTQDGISLVQTADGALNEVQEMIQRMRELSIKAANGTCTGSDRESIQQEVDALILEVDRTAQSTEYNTIKLLDGSLSDNSMHLVSATYAFTTSQTPSGGDTTVGHERLADNLEKQIVPQIVNNILSKYSAFSYLGGSTIGIGLKLYSQSGNTLAYVSSGYQEGGSGGTVGSKEYQLGVNLRHLDFQADGNLTAASRQELESTIAHEMIHAFMAESMTNGMMGKDRFPLWFVEGMAQTAAGPGGWTSSLNAASSNDAIRNFLSKIGPGYGSGDGAANYGTGYLANMYLGYMAGSGTDMASRITDGLNKIMNTIIGGASLDDAIANHTTYGGLTDFSNNLKNDHDAYDFVRDLITATSSGRGGLVTGDLTDTDLAADIYLPGMNVFKLYADKEKVKNTYSGSYVILSGGGARTPEPPPGSSSSGGLGVIGGKGLDLQIGAQSNQTMHISIDSVTASDLGLQHLSVTTQESARWAMESCDSAMERVSSVRSTLGAYQNRLEHTIANLDNISENTQAAESSIRDTDMAKQTVKYSLNQIIMQVSQAMLAQANQSTQSVLSILS